MMHCGVKHIKRTCLSVMCAFFISCAGDVPVPKPLAYPRFTRMASDTTQQYASSVFSFVCNGRAKVDTVPGASADQIWLNIQFPLYGATLHCTYMPIKGGDLRAALEDNHQLLYSHALQADKMKETTIGIPDENVYASLFELSGNVATPIQFFLTDSVSGFFRGSLYYDHKVDADAVSPMTEYMKEDITSLIESFRWAKKNKDRP